MSTAAFSVAPAAGTTSSRVATNPNRDEIGARGGVLDAYSRALDGQPLLTAEEEYELARRIQDLRRAYWRRLLAYRPFLDQILDRIEEAVAPEVGRDCDFDAVRACLARDKARSTTSTRSALGDALDRLAQDLSRLDPCCDIADPIFADVEAVGFRADAGRRSGLQAPRRSTVPLQGHVRELQRARLALLAARRQFARANLRLVVLMASRYRYSGRLSFADLIQEGNVGLMIAVDRFDPERGFRFSTYGSWWIRHAISRALSARGRTVRVPVHVLELQGRLSRARRDFEQAHARAPTPEELADRVGMATEKVERLGYVLLDEEQPFSPRSTDEPGRVRGMDALPDNAAELDDALYARHLDDAVQTALETLRPMELEILRMRYGLDGRERATLREIGALHSLSRERIRQIQERALEKLRKALEQKGFEGIPRALEATGA